MATFSHLPSGKWRAQVRRAGLYRNATFEKKRDAEARRRMNDRKLFSSSLPAVGNNPHSALALAC